ncbi:MAG: DciA family protein [bacterium]|nr:DciA family protein [bacterium]
MKKIGLLLNKRKNAPREKLDEKSIFYLFQKIIKEEYGNQGFQKLKPVFLKNGKLFIKSQSSVWANEIYLNRENFIRKMNREIGEKEIFEIKIN